MFLTETQTNPSDVLSVLGPVFAFYGFFFLYAVAQYVLMGIFLSKVFVKTGNEGWPAWVPIYNSWRILEIAGYQGWIALLSLVPFANIVALVYLIMAVNRLNKGFGRSAGWTVLYVFLPLIWGALIGYGRTEPWRGPSAWMLQPEYPGYPQPAGQPYPPQATPYPPQASPYSPQATPYAPQAAAPYSTAAATPPVPPTPPQPTDPNPGA
ncbi:DUF5684 domain-containing protein [Agromyces endophyticus]|uniref:DUF5684 domain-containing protein n=1 Tax=Agromyces sp. H17E-10 TaxID=2932244 RepID=UPI001FD07675|nr:DUF5684 domain-containing protein [Agromyces sp. H17E-10]UOQ88073.1 DUF5684 domain-containing protein [Agromyces sp. H17E-10]